MTKYCISQDLLTLWMQKNTWIQYNLTVSEFQPLISADTIVRAFKPRPTEATTTKLNILSTPAPVLQTTIYYKIYRYTTKPTTQNYRRRHTSKSRRQKNKKRSHRKPMCRLWSPIGPKYVYPNDWGAAYICKIYPTLPIRWFPNL